MKNSDTLFFRFDFNRRNSRCIIFSVVDRFIENIHELPQEFGDGYARFCQKDSGLGFGEFCTKGIPEPFNSSISINRDCIKIPFLLSKKPVYVGIEGEKGDILLDSSTSYLLSPDSIGTVSYPTGIPFHTITFLLPVDRLESIVEDSVKSPGGILTRVLEGEPVPPYLHRGIVTPSIRSVVDKIRHCRMVGSLRNLYIEGKILELAALRLQSFFNEADARQAPAYPLLTGTDRRKILDAAEILESSVEHPPTISRLAGEVGLNTTKLKYGFRSVLGITVFGYLHFLRMQEALVLLRDTDSNVSEVAFRVGYGHVGSFSAAFKKQFGFSPSSLTQDQRGHRRSPGP